MMRGDLFPSLRLFDMGLCIKQKLFIHTRACDIPIPSLGIYPNSVCSNNDKCLEIIICVIKISISFSPQLQRPTGL